MEEDIKILEEFIDTNSGALKIWQISDISECEKLRQAIENLINKYKEQEKVIELMAKFINNIDIDEDICKVMGEKPYCDEYYNANNCIKCVIDYFKKKARDENGNRNDN